MTPENPNILIIRLSAIGDVLHCTTAAHRLKEIYPHCHLTWLVSPPAAELLENNPDIDKLLIWDRQKADRAFSHFQIKSLLHALHEAYLLLKPYHFDIVLDLQGLFLTGILSLLSGAKRRIGIHERHEGNPLFMTEMAPNIKNPHKVYRYMTVLFPLGIKDFTPGLHLPITSAQSAFAESFLQKLSITPDKKLLFVSVITSWQSKDWKPSFFIEALQSITKNKEVQIIFCGTPSDRPTIEQLQKNLPNSISIAGKTSLTELAALFTKGTLLLASDTGPLHIADAVGLSTLSLWGPTHPDIYGPLTAGHHFIVTEHPCRSCCKTKCKYKTNACMNAISPAIVEKKLRELLAL